MPSAKRAITIRVTQTADDWITERADGHDVHLSVVLRAMLTVATQHPREVDAKITQLKEL